MIDAHQIPDGGMQVVVRNPILDGLDDTGRAPVWLASLNGRSAPRQVTIKEPRSAGGCVVFMAEEKGTKFVYRVKEDGIEL